jgi:hypothetical protein
MNILEIVANFDSKKIQFLQEIGFLRYFRFSPKPTLRLPDLFQNDERWLSFSQTYNFNL